MIHVVNSKRAEVDELLREVMKDEKEGVVCIPFSRSDIG